MVATDITPDTARRCLQVGLRPGYSVVKLSGQYAGSNRPDLVIRRSTPFTRLPHGLLDKDITDWKDVASGRWLFEDHITLGESRVVVLLCKMLVACPSAHRCKVLSLQDNTACAGSFAKGRSPSPLLNFLLRKKAAHCIAAELQVMLPWVETSRQPADELSRVCTEGNRP